MDSICLGTEWKLYTCTMRQESGSFAEQAVAQEQLKLCVATQQQRCVRSSLALLWGRHWTDLAEPEGASGLSAE